MIIRSNSDLLIRDYLFTVSTDIGKRSNLKFPDIVVRISELIISTPSGLYNQGILPFVKATTSPANQIRKGFVFYFEKVLPIKQDTNFSKIRDYLESFIEDYGNNSTLEQIFAGNGNLSNKKQEEALFQKINDILLLLSDAIEMIENSRFAPIPIEQAQETKPKPSGSGKGKKEYETEECSDNVPPTFEPITNISSINKELCIDWTLTDKKTPFFSEEDSKYYIAYDIVVEDFKILKANVNNYKAECLKILNDTFVLGIDIDKVDPMVFMKHEKFYFEPRDFKPSKILYSASQKTIISAPKKERIPPTRPPTSNIGETKSYIFEVKEFISVLDKVVSKMEKFNTEYGIWKFITPQSEFVSLQKSGGVTRDVEKLRLFKSLFFRLADRNGIDLDSSPQNRLKLYFSESSDPTITPHDLIRVEYLTISRYSSKLIWNFGQDELGGLKANEPFDDVASVNYLYNLDEIKLVIDTISWNSFYEKYRIPSVSFEANNGEDLLKTKGLGIAKDLTERVINDVLGDLLDSDGALKNYADKYNSKPFKQLESKLLEDAALRDAQEKQRRANLVARGKLDTGDSVAAVLNKAVFTPGQHTDFVKDVLNPLGINFVKFAGLLSLSLVARSIPVEKLRELNLKQYFAYLDPQYLLNLTLQSISESGPAGNEIVKDLSFGVNLVNGVLRDTSFDSKVQQIYLDYVRENAEPGSDLANIGSYDELVVLYEKEASTLSNATDEQIDQATIDRASQNMKLTIDFLKNGQISLPNLTLSTQDPNTGIGSAISLSSLSSRLSNTYEQINTDIEGIFAGFENCELPNPDIFYKYRDLAINLKVFFESFKRFKYPKIKAIKLNIPDQKAVIQAILTNIIISLFYVVISQIIKLVLDKINQLTSDQACAQLSALIEQNGGLTQGNQFAESIVEEMSKVIPSNRRLSPDEAFDTLNSTAQKIGLSNNISTEVLSSFIYTVNSVLTQRELCDLLGGTATSSTIQIVKNIIEIKYADSGISSNSEDIAAYFGGIGTFISPECINMISRDDIPVNTIFCSTPEDYRMYTDLRCELLKDKGLDASECEKQLDLLGCIAEKQATDLLKLINSPDPFGSMDMSPSSLIPGLDEIISDELSSSYDSIFNSIEAAFVADSIAGNGLINSILSNRKGILYPAYQNLSALNNVLQISRPENIGEKPTRVATWLRYNSSFVAATGKNKTTSNPLIGDSNFETIRGLSENEELTFKQIDRLFDNSNFNFQSYFAPNSYDFKSNSGDFDSHRLKSYNFFILPYQENKYSIDTKIIDYNPIVPLFAVNDGTFMLDQVTYPLVPKSFSFETINKPSEDYMINIDTDLDAYGSTKYDPLINSFRSSVFKDIVVNSIKDHLLIDGKYVTSEFQDVIANGVFNYAYNSFSDGFNGILSVNDKNFTYGETEKQINSLNSQHVNTYTQVSSPVDPQEFGGTEKEPQFYIYTKLSDNWISFYNASNTEAKSLFEPRKTIPPDMGSISREASRLSSKLKEDEREATDRSNQTPFDLITTKNSIATMDGLIHSFIRTIVYEYYVKAFPVLNTVEVNKSTFDSVFYKFLINRTKEELHKAGGKTVKEKNDFYYRFLEMVGCISIKKKDEDIENFSNEETQLLEKLVRKSNIWKYGIPSRNLTPSEVSYFKASDKIAELEIPNYPQGIFKTAILTGKTGSEITSAYESGKINKQKQIELRDFYWLSIMTDTESICLELLEKIIIQEFQKIVDQFSVLNPYLSKLNNILYTPLIGGPTVQTIVKRPLFLATSKDGSTNQNGFILIDADETIKSGPTEPIPASPWCYLENNTTEGAANKITADFDLRYKEYLGRTKSVIEGFGQDEIIFNDPVFGDIRLNENKIPFIVEKYIRIEKDSDTQGIETQYQPLADKLYELLYSEQKLSTNLRSTKGFTAFPRIKPGYFSSIFTGPVGLGNLVDYLEFNDFFINLTQEELSTPINKLFKDVKFGLRLKMLIPTNNDGYLNMLDPNKEADFLNEITSDTTQLVQIAKEKCFHSKDNYSIPLFVEERMLGDEFTLESILKAKDENFRYKIEKTYIQGLMNQMVCSKEYKILFDFCIPMRYFMSLSAIYCSKGFMPSIGSIDWNDSTLLVTNKTSFRSYDQSNVFKNTREIIAKLFNTSYTSYEIDNKDEQFDSREEFRNSLSNQTAESDATPSDQEKQKFFDTIKSGGTLQEAFGSLSNIDSINKILPPKAKERFINDPTNKFGNAFNETESK